MIDVILDKSTLKHMSDTFDKLKIYFILLCIQKVNKYHINKLRKSREKAKGNKKREAVFEACESKLNIKTESTVDMHKGRIS